jgi:cell division cycle protein 37
MERQQRKLEIDALKHRRIINDKLIGHIRALSSTLEYRHDLPPLRDPTDIAFQSIREWAWNTVVDNPPPPPESVFDVNSPPLPTYSRMMATLVDEVNETLFGRQVEKDQRNDAFIQELKVQIRKFEGLQKDLTTKLDALEKQDSSKITSDSYHIGFDSSHVSKAKQGKTSAGDTKIELLNPKSSLDEVDSNPSNTAATPALGDGEERVRASPAAKKFAEIPVSDYRASQEYILSHPEILRNESDTDALLVEAYYAILDQDDEARARQHVHQAMLLQYCRMVGRGGVPVFFRRIATPGQPAREVFENDVVERFQKLRAIAKRDGKQRLAVDEDTAVEQFQLYPVGHDTSILIQVPPAESEDEQVKKARSVFEQFAPDMRAALESGSLDEVNKTLGKMEVSEAEKMVSLLQEVTSCPVYCAS